MNFKFTRAQELTLIELGIKQLLTLVEQPKSHHRKSAPAMKVEEPKRKWSDAQRTKFRATMKKHWATRKSAKVTNNEG